MVKVIRNIPIKDWRRWLRRQVENPDENTKKHPDVLYVLKAFQDLVYQVEEEKYAKGMIEVINFGDKK